eukprot:Blabericola_migrator_1__7679@NODE_391_length_9042_cov_77_341616_g312_i0_p1_GENE_NODE_391_length_9042_cov_77_341616_g312_i0NODE_391_length_9042_cov_77_341616_g312_i0_p1_ORF_typecomplete_len595_score100_00Ada3/PF10198_9/8_1e03Ada3/PF10198_9/0_28_NODE_391_length_9042_cov_77_341616_g312_i055397323
MGGVDYVKECMDINVGPTKSKKALDDLIAKVSSNNEGDDFRRALCLHMLYYQKKDLPACLEPLKKAIELSDDLNISSADKVEIQTLLLINFKAVEATISGALTSLLNCPATSAEAKALKVPDLNSLDIQSHELAYNTFLLKLSTESTLKEAESYLRRTEGLLDYVHEEQKLPHKSLHENPDFFPIGLARALLNVEAKKQTPLELCKLLIQWQQAFVAEYREAGTMPAAKNPERVLTWILLIRLNLLAAQYDNKALQAELSSLYDKEHKELFHVEVIANSPMKLQLLLEQGGTFHSTITKWKNVVGQKLGINQKAQYYKSTLCIKSRQAQSLGVRKGLLLSLMKDVQLRRLGAKTDLLLSRSNSALGLLVKIMQLCQELAQNQLGYFNLTPIVLRVWYLAVSNYNSDAVVTILRHLPWNVLVEGAVKSQGDFNRAESLYRLTMFTDKVNSTLCYIAHDWHDGIMVALRKLEGDLAARMSKWKDMAAPFAGTLPEEHPYDNLAKILRAGDAQTIPTYNEELSMNLDADVFLIDGEDLEMNCDWRSLVAQRIERMKSKPTRLREESCDPPSVKATSAKKSSRRKMGAKGVSGLGVQH